MFVPYSTPEDLITAIGEITEVIYKYQIILMGLT